MAPAAAARRLNVGAHGPAMLGALAGGVDGEVVGRGHHLELEHGVAGQIERIESIEITHAVPPHRIKKCRRRASGGGHVISLSPLMSGHGPRIRGGPVNAR